MNKSLTQERWTFRLDLLAQEAIRVNDGIFQSRLGLKVHEVRVLRIIGRQPGIIFVDLSRQASLERSQTSRIIQRLIKQGLVRRENDEADARRFRLFTTAQGEATRDQARKLSDALEELLMAPLQAAEAEVFNELLARLSSWVGSSNYQRRLDAFGAEAQMPSE
ncbi:MarR family transcriptional regulator [Oceanimonas sp. GK1]|uniref:MarR family winged helix-turn-helix transcriptional regulator n=1 Tax=Oceanimonas sp. (strain GK1 / IBRC-M 10197) TaxID=511062 RepID=UPI000249506B|nr:MarR family winged helix-turn-helix transcriptional regulator [Oceanimonas sp. GK1]AEY02240.1 MarR family transcriptional regulator [Oceanimonas sp. GK1]